MLVGFAGVKRVGKDVVAAHLVDHHAFTRYAFAAPLKDLCARMFGLTRDQVDGHAKDIVVPKYGMSPRRIMQLVGTDCVRTIAPDFWTDAFDAWLTSRSPVGSVVVSDVRFQNEVDLIHARGGLVFLLTRQCCDTCDRHVSERASSLTGLDGVIRNDSSTADLCRAVDRALKYKS